MAPARNTLPTDRLAMAEKMIASRLGGISCPSAPPDKIVPSAMFLL